MTDESGSKRFDHRPGRARYVALYRDGANSYFRFVHVQFPDGMIPPPTINMGVPHSGVHEFGRADTQEEIALLYDTTQQSVSRWMKNQAPTLGET